MATACIAVAIFFSALVTDWKAISKCTANVGVDYANKNKGAMVNFPFFAT